MAVRRHNLPLFAGTEDTEDMFLATMEEVDKDLPNLVKVDHALYNYLKEKRLIREMGTISTNISIPLLAKENSTVKFFTGYDDMDLNPQSATHNAKFLWGHAGGVQMYSHEEMRKNEGESQIIDLTQTKTEQLHTSMNNKVGERIVGAQDCNGRDFMGIGRIMTPGATVGGIDPSHKGFGYWDVQQTFKDDANSTKFALSSEMRKGMRKLRRDCTHNGMSPDVYMCGEDVYDAVLEDLEGKIRMSPKEEQMFEGHEAFAHNNLVYIYDKDLDAKTTWALNFRDKAIEVRVDKKTNFVMTPWQWTNGKVAKHRYCLLYMAVVCRRRNLNGVLKFS
ncbi:phage major capsid protein [Endozoicomonas gorgoniicola]|uniref:Phage major capsid protein n=1 Tax=Endozoicomonas gorgoniicola TaxID=1234144 RepID=A0ABT3N1M6_9GAMM|nr:phage major capsid protein [Endozoicomonas gorgoniicola]MCW7555533.1 phage major capsid protein [Endozoicomonas gorgoniicola]